MIRDAFYWAPFMSAYVGMRLEEISQLKVEDHCEEEGVLVFRIEERDDQGVKTSISERNVPIHPVGVRLGLLKRADALRDRGEVRLFPELKRQGRSRKYGTAITKWFARYRRQVGLYAPKKDFHSFRHSFVTYLDRAGAPLHQVSGLLGHVPQGETNGRYQKGLSPRELKPIIELLDYGIAEHMG